jgi:hypothetical protein
MKKIIILILLIICFRLDGQLGTCVCYNGEQLCKTPIYLGNINDEYELLGIVHAFCPLYCNSYDNWQEWNDNYDDTPFNPCLHQPFAGG